MRRIHAGHVVLDFLPPPWRRALARRMQEGAGLAVILAAALLGASLASWSIADPSLNHATAAPVHNLLGRPGAFLSDPLMQALGLAAAALVLPPLAWGLRIMAGRSIGLWRWRPVAGLAGAALLAGALAALPVPPRWPLPTGLGGFVGDGLLAVPIAALKGLLGRSAGVLGGFAYGGSAALALALACGFLGRRNQALRRKPKRVEPDLDEPGPAEAAGPDAASRASVALGAAAHLALRLGAGLGRLLPRAAPDSAGPKPGLLKRLTERLLADDDPLAGFAARAGAEPVRVADVRAPALEPAPAQADRDGWNEIVEAIAAPEPRPRKPVMPAAPPPRPANQDYELPSLQLLAAPKPRAADPSLSETALRANAQDLEGVLDDFGVKGEIIAVRPGPVVTLHELQPAPGIKSSRVIGLADDIARSMSAVSTRVAVVPGRNVIGIELPNARRETVYLRELLAAPEFASAKARLPLCLGKTIGGEPVIGDLARMPHLLIAGTTGSGKSVAINTMILSLLYRLKPAECRLIMVDPKMLELSVYDGIPHLLAPVVTDPKKAVTALKWTVREMEDRYRKMSKLGVRNIDGYNQRIAQAASRGEVITRTVQTGFDKDTGQPIFEQEEMDLDPLPYIVVIVDEMADLMMVAGKDIEGAIQRLAQMARAAGIHIVMATQRPSVDVITGTIKANFPTRISFQVTSKIDSRTILGEQGAEQLLGQGDMLYMMGGGRISRVHGPFVSDEEVEKVVDHLKRQGAPDYLDAVTAEEDEDGNEPLPDLGIGAGEGEDLYGQAVQIVLRDRKASTSYVQRRLQIGYNRAASLVERMEKEGIVGPANHAGKREILVGEDA